MVSPPVIKASRLVKSKLVIPSVSVPTSAPALSHSSKTPGGVIAGIIAMFKLKVPTTVHPVVVFSRRTQIGVVGALAK